MRESLEKYEGDFGRREARHLLMRTCLGCSSRDISLAVELGLEKTLSSLLAGEFSPRVSSESESRLGKLTASSFEQLRASFIQRALVGGDALRSTMTLLLHDHFATAFRKVRSIPFMDAHLKLLRSHALGGFAELLLQMADDPAMLIWLDGATSTKDRPNENFARELFELFSLGHGNYDESDIKAAARVFTGRKVDSAGTRFVPTEHDDSQKSAFGESFKTESELIQLVLKQPACARFLGLKIGRCFLGETVADDIADLLGNLMRQHEFQLGAFLLDLLQSKAMFSIAASQRRIRSPLEFVIGSLRALELRGNSYAMATFAATMGQSLADPPSVAGWPVGRAWISTATIIARQRFALEVAKAGKSELKLKRTKATLPDVKEVAEALLGAAAAESVEVDSSTSFFQQAATLLSHPEAQLI